MISETKNEEFLLYLNSIKNGIESMEYNFSSLVRIMEDIRDVLEDLKGGISIKNG